MARARRKKKGRAAGFLLLAGLALLIAGFIARREIPNLIRQAHSPAAAAHADIGGVPDLSGGEKLHPPDEPRLYAGTGEGGAGQRTVSPGGNDSHSAARENQSGEHINGSERRQLDNLIKEKSQ